MTLFFKFRFVFNYTSHKGKSQASRSLKFRFLFRYVAYKGKSQA